MLFCYVCSLEFSVESHIHPATQSVWVARPIRLISYVDVDGRAIALAQIGRNCDSIPITICTFQREGHAAFTKMPINVAYVLNIKAFVIVKAMVVFIVEIIRIKA